MQFLVDQGKQRLERVGVAVAPGDEPPGYLSLVWQGGLLGWSGIVWRRVHRDSVESRLPHRRMMPSGYGKSNEKNGVICHLPARSPLKGFHFRSQNNENK